jgi:SAM-dependent methyltransferase
VQFDATGKVTLGHIYTQPDPRAYFETLHAFDYQLPELARPYFGRLAGEYREARGVRVPNILDVGCSYGINAALLKCNTTMAALYERYCGPAAGGLTRDALLARDREMIRSCGGLEPVRVVGLDSSRPALSYALAAGFIDGAVHADLERRDPTAAERDQLADIDLVISTGAIGYIGQRTLSRVVGAAGRRRPWLAHFVLRMFPFDPVAESLAGAGYRTVHVDRMFRQRRFASAEEQSLILGNLSAIGVDPSGLEDGGWLYAQLYISRPDGTGE